MSLNYLVSILTGDGLLNFAKEAQRAQEKYEEARWTLVQCCIKSKRLLTKLNIETVWIFNG